MSLASASPQPQRHVPERSCVACRRKRPQGEFARLVRTESGWMLAGRKQSGRGAYVCADTPGCWAEKKLRRAFGAQAQALSHQLQAQLQDHHELNQTNHPAAQS